MVKDPVYDGHNRSTGDGGVGRPWRPGLDESPARAGASAPRLSEARRLADTGEAGVATPASVARRPTDRWASEPAFGRLLVGRRPRGARLSRSRVYKIVSPDLLN